MEMVWKTVPCSRSGMREAALSELGSAPRLGVDSCRRIWDQVVICALVIGAIQLIHFLSYYYSVVSSAHKRLIVIDDTTVFHTRHLKTLLCACLTPQVTQSLVSLVSFRSPYSTLITDPNESSVICFWRCMNDCEWMTLYHFLPAIFFFPVRPKVMINSICFCECQSVQIFNSGTKLHWQTMHYCSSSVMRRVWIWSSV